ncbi:MAG: endonuclease/exonuclease/phosphatase family protein [Hyphomonas sp.]|nr:endonuclease/exonuclease/phosphatase family protein [Hyphomonas sp.]
MRVVNWNIERRGPHSWQAASLASEIQSLEPDLVFLTEAHHDSLSQMGGFTIDHPGYDAGRKAASERLVLLWSRSEWEALPLPKNLHSAGGAVLGKTLVGDQTVFCLCICIPWHMCPTIKMDGKVVPWAQHVAFLKEIKPLLRELENTHSPLIVAGDFNRRIPRRWGPIEAYDLLTQAFDGLDIITTEALQPENAATIDHIAISSALTSKSVRTLSAIDPERRRPRSDHFGVLAELEIRI